jgi:hypothetical protein
MQAPFADVPSSGFDEWFSSRSSNFRQQARSRRREFLRRGLPRPFPLSSPEERGVGRRDLDVLGLDVYDVQIDERSRLALMVESEQARGRVPGPRSRRRAWPLDGLPVVRLGTQVVDKGPTPRPTTRGNRGHKDADTLLYKIRLLPPWCRAAHDK